MTKQKEKIVAILEKLGLEPVDKGDYYILVCPDCGHKEAFLYKTFKNIVCNRRNKCGYHEKLSVFLKKAKANDLSITNKDIQKVKSEQVKETKPGELEIPEGLKFFSEEKGGLFYDQAYNYLRNRNIPKKNIMKLGYIFSTGSVFDRTIFFPFFENEKIVYFVARTWNKKIITDKNTGKEKELRYIMPKGFDSNSFIFNYDEIEEEKDLFIFEGLLDALSLEWQVGTAMLTNTLGTKQASKIWDRTPRRIIFVNDNDEAGEKSTYKNYKNLLFMRPPSLNKTEILQYNLEKKYKDFNEKCQNEGVNEIEENFEHIDKKIALQVSRAIK